MTVASVSVKEFRVGEVLGRALSILGRNIVPFGILALIFTAPSSVLGMMVDPQGGGMFDQKTLHAMEAGNPDALKDVGVQLAALIGVVALSMVFSVLATSTMVYGTFQDLRREPAAIGASLRRGLGSVFPVVGVALLSTLAMMLGLVALVIPGIMIMIALWVAVPTAVVERPGVIASLKRSAALTKGHRWRILGILAVLAVISGVATSVVQTPFTVSMLEAGPKGISSGMYFAYNGMVLVVTAFFTAFSAVASAVAYHDLRAVKEGFDIDRFAAVFD